MQIDKAHCVAFTGHREHKTIIQDHNLFTTSLTTSEQLVLELSNLISEGYHTFLGGMAEGFDLLAAEIVLQLIDGNKSVKFIAVIPFKSQANNFSQENKRRYLGILDRCDSNIILSDKYFAGCYSVRNDFLVENSSVLVTNFNGTKGGTEYTVKQGVKRKHRIVVLR